MPNDRGRFLSTLSEAQLRALHAELEALDREQAGVVEDTTPQVSDLLAMVWKQEAALRHDPESYFAAAKAHHERWRFHLRRLEAGRPQPSSVKELLMASSPKDWAEAKRLAIADGFPDPATIPDEPKVEDEVAAALKGRTKRSE